MLTPVLGTPLQDGTDASAGAALQRAEHVHSEAMASIELTIFHLAPYWPVIKSPS